MSILERPLRRLADSPLARVATWPHGVDGYAGAFDTAWSSRGVRARVAAVRRQTGDTVTLTLRPNANWQGHQAGQHVLLTVEVDGVRQSRCFSVASAPGASSVELTCKVGPHSVVARHLREQASVGDLVELSQAQGEFVLDDDASAGRPVLLVSAGSGITPVLSMLRALDERAGADATPVTFAHYARGGDDVLYAAEVAEIVARHPMWRAVTVTEHDITGDLHGRFEPGHLAAMGVRPRAGEAYVCGPAPFMQAVSGAWRQAGGAASRFHTESYGSPAVPASGRAGGTLRFARTGVEVADDGRSILEQAEAAGISPAHGCRRGICHTCVVPRASGCVRLLADGTAEATAADAAGTPVRICVTAPDGDVELDL
jgi:stearoyl-CoA 9-desaturase NADPH oxidoreductase